jgi:hypothetical protein
MKACGGMAKHILKIGLGKEYSVLCKGLDEAGSKGSLDFAVKCLLPAGNRTSVP